MLQNPSKLDLHRGHSVKLGKQQPAASPSRLKGSDNVDSAGRGISSNGRLVGPRQPKLSLMEQGVPPDLNRKQTCSALPGSKNLPPR
mmetsp:Transcript_3502/g.5978  ORF Transcript_3502/g.5978 Transcript_3502/m.5978 type:complete len:87 (+) Transcript_3502:547-807(+)